jgi:acyl-CoA synthetase (AMP-forming)/AMP-acid ligase II/acyl carrier protein
VVGRQVVVPEPLRLLRTGAAPLAPALQNALEANLGIPVMQGYGMTETGAIARNPLPPAPRPAGSVGKPLFPGVAILGADDAIGPWQEIGEVVVRGPGVMTGYENNAEANRLAFHDGWFRTGDLGRFDADGYLFLTGRIRELINRGGLKVSPAEVDAAMLQHAAVLEAATFAVPHPSLGEDVAVAVVLRRPGCVSASELRLHALQHLAPFKVPSTVVIVGALPKNASGKIDRGALAHALRDALRPPFQAPRDADEARVAGIFAAVLKQSAVGAHDNFFELGGDSLSAMQVVARVNAAFRIVLPVRSLFEAPTAALFAEAARKVRTVT